MKILTPTDPNWSVLSSVANPVTDFVTQVKPHLAEMIQILTRKKALGLAAPQVGIPFRFFLFRPHPRAVYNVAINPRIMWSSPDVRGGFEGCLSFPGKEVSVQRPESVRVEYKAHYYDHGMRERLLVGMEARVFQHELDHLNGVTVFPSNTERQPGEPVKPVTSSDELPRRRGMLVPTMIAAALAVGGMR